MITRVGMAPRAAGLTYASFQEHWRSEHAGLAGRDSRPARLRAEPRRARATAGRSCRIPASTPAPRSSSTASPRWTTAFASEHYRQAVTADEHSLIDKSRFALILTERRVLADGDARRRRGQAADVPAASTRARRGRRSTSGSPARYREIVAEARAAAARAAARDPGRARGPPAAPCAPPSTSSGSRAAEQALDFVHGEIGHRGRLRARRRRLRARARCSPGRSASSEQRARERSGERVDGLAALGDRGGDVARLAGVAHRRPTSAPRRSSPSNADGGAPIGDHEPVGRDERLCAPASSAQRTPSAVSASGRPRRRRTPSRSSRRHVGAPHEPARVEARPLAVQQRHLAPPPGRTRERRRAPAARRRATTGRAGGGRSPSVEGCPSSRSSIVHVGSAS